MSRPRNPFGARLDRLGFRGPLSLDHASRGLVIDADGKSLALALPVFTDPADRDWFAGELMRALNARLGLPEAPVDDQFDPRHIAAVEETSRAFARRVTPGPLSDAAE